MNSQRSSSSSTRALGSVVSAKEDAIQNFRRELLLTCEQNFASQRYGGDSAQGLALLSTFDLEHFKACVRVYVPVLRDYLRGSLGQFLRAQVDKACKG